MPGGDKNINGSDGNTFQKGNKAHEKYDEASALEIADELIEWISKRGKQNMFFNEFFLIKKGLYEEFGRKMSKRFPSFKERYDKAKAIQELKLIKYGVLKELDSGMTKFVLANNHNYTERSENTNINDNINSELTKKERQSRIDDLLKKRSKK